MWEDDWRVNGSWYLRWGPLAPAPYPTQCPPPANGLYSWDESAISSFGTPGNTWTFFWMLLCTPIIPLDAANDTAYVEFMTHVESYDNPPLFPIGAYAAAGKLCGRCMLFHW